MVLPILAVAAAPKAVIHLARASLRMANPLAANLPRPSLQMVNLLATNPLRVSPLTVNLPRPDLQALKRPSATVPHHTLGQSPQPVQAQPAAPTSQFLTAWKPV